MGSCIAGKHQTRVSCFFALALAKGKGVFFSRRTRFVLSFFSFFDFPLFFFLLLPSFSLTGRDRTARTHGPLQMLLFLFMNWKERA